MKAILPAVTLCAVSAAGPEITRTADVAWIAEGNFCEPETVLAMPDGSLLVSNVCDFRQPGTGFLTRQGHDGEVVAWRAVDALDAPLGMALHGDELLVVDANRIRRFALPELAPGAVLPLETAVANDIAVDPNGTIYVTDTGRGEVIVIDADSGPEPLLGAGRFPGANGIAATADTLLVGGEALWQVTLATGAIERLGPAWLGDIDGIELEADGTIQVTPVGGPLIRLRDGAVIDVIGGPGVSSANHGYAAAFGLALIPTGFDNTVIAVRLSP